MCLGGTACGAQESALCVSVLLWITQTVPKVLGQGCFMHAASNRGAWYGLMHADVQTSATAAALFLLLLAAPQVSSWSSFWPLFLRVVSSSLRSDLWPNGCFTKNFS